jgi:hypothetical protein
MTIPSSERNALLALVERFPRQRVIMLGDLVADESVYGEIMRVSREAPVLILKERENRSFLAEAPIPRQPRGARSPGYAGGSCRDDESRAMACSDTFAKGKFPPGTSSACPAT